MHLASENVPFARVAIEFVFEYLSLYSKRRTTLNAHWLSVSVRCRISSSMDANVLLSSFDHYLLMQ